MVARILKKEVKEKERRNEKNEMFRDQPQSDREKNDIGKVGAIYRARGRQKRRGSGKERR